MLKKSKEDQVAAVESVDWPRVLLSPEIVDTNADGKDHRTRAVDFISKKVNKANQQFTAMILDLEISDGNQSLASALIQSSHGRYLTRVCTFARQPGILAAAHEQYETTFSAKARKEHRAGLESVGRGNIGVQAFTRLLLLIKEDVANVEKVFLRSKWRSRATRQAYAADKPITTDTVEGLKNNAEQLAEKFVVRGKDSSARLFLDAEIQPGQHIFLFQRELGARQQVDYRQGLKVYHDFGWVLFCVNFHTGRIAFKGGGEQNANLVCRWIEENSKGLSLTPEGSRPFSAYEFERVANSLLGDYPTDSKVRLLSLSLARCNRRSLSPITLGPPSYGDSIREDVRYLRDQESISLVSLFDLERLQVRFGDYTVSVSAEPAAGGTLILRADDSNFNEGDFPAFLDAFEAAFGIPLNVRIDLRSSNMGHAPTYASLLDATGRGAVPAHLREDLEELIDRNILRVDETREMHCGSNTCSVDSVVSDGSDCPSCHSPLASRRRESIARDKDGILRVLKHVFKANSTRKILKGLERDQKHGEVYQLAPTNSGDVPFAVLVAEQSDRFLLGRCSKFHRPVLVVHTHGYRGRPYVDTIGMVHVHLADILAAEKQPTELGEFFAQLEDFMQQSQRRAEESLLRAAAEADRNLTTLGDASSADDYGDQDFERDVFSLKRTLFPFTDKWGGGNKTDGFVSVPYAVDGNLRNIAKLNFSYDAKLTRKLTTGYELNKSEKRKAFDYVLALQQQPILQVDGNKLNAHVFVSNLVTSRAAEGVAAHFRQTHNDLALEYPVPIVVMRTGFLLRLYQDFQRSRLEFQKRQLFLGRELMRLFDTANKDGFVVLEEKDASAFVEDFLKLPPMAKPVDGEELRSSLAKR